MTLWTAEDAGEATGGAVTTDWAATGVSIDTRTLVAGDLFVALKAERDGHDYVAAALAKGAAAAMVSHVPEGLAPDAPLLIVEDVQAGLEALGRAARERTKAKVIGVTGSVGKTSTKEMLRAVLSGQGKCHAAEASYNNHWGVPLTLARMPADTDFAVIEIGMNHPGEISPLARLARLHVAMITTVGAAHLEAFDSVEGIAAEKASILDGLEADGYAVLNADIPTAPILKKAAQRLGDRAIWFGEAGANWRLGRVRVTDEATVIQATHNSAPVLFKLGIAGRHFAMNGLAVLAVAEAVGADPVAAALDIANWQPPAGRGTREQIVLDPARSTDYLDLIDDAFNANPTSMSAALEVLAVSTPRDGVGRVAKGRRVAILGDMLELGPEETALHAALAQDVSIPEISVIHCSGVRMRSLWEALPEGQRGRWTATATEMVAEAARLVDAGDVVLVKGSKGSRISLVVDAIRKLGQRRPISEEGN